VLLSSELASNILVELCGLIAVLILFLLDVELFMHEIVVELYLADEAAVLESTIEGLEPLKDGVNHERVILVAYCYQVSMAIMVSSQFQRAISFGYVDADGVAASTLDHFVKLEVFKGEDAKVPIVASSNDPVLFTVAAHPKGHQVVDLTHVKSQHHVGVYFLDLVLVVAHNVVEATVRVDLALNCDAFFDFFETLMQDTYVSLAFARTHLASLLVGSCVVLIKIESLDGFLENFDDLLSCVLFELGLASPNQGHVVSVVHLLVSLAQVRVMTCGDADDLVVAVFRVTLVAEENVEGAVLEDNNKFIRVSSLLIGFKPTDVVNFTPLLYLFYIVILDDNTPVLQLWIIAADCASFSSQEKLDLGLVLAIHFVVGARVLALSHVSNRWHALAANRLRNFVLKQEGGKVDAGLEHLGHVAACWNILSLVDIGDENL